MCMYMATSETASTLQPTRNQVHTVSCSVLRRFSTFTNGTFLKHLYTTLAVQLYVYFVEPQRLMRDWNPNTNQLPLRPVCR